LRNVPDVGALLPRESSASQVGLSQRCNPLGRDGAGKSLQPSVGGTACRQRYLLLEDDLHQRLEAGRTIPQRRNAVAFDDSGEVRIAPRELGDAMGKAVDCELWRHLNLTTQLTWL
jgi:hypothetical protein